MLGVGQGVTLDQVGRIDPAAFLTFAGRWPRLDIAPERTTNDQDQSKGPGGWNYTAQDLGRLRGANLGPFCFCLCPRVSF